MMPTTISWFGSCFWVWLVGAVMYWFALSEWDWSELNRRFAIHKMKVRWQTNLFYAPVFKEGAFLQVIACPALCLQKRGGFDGSWKLDVNHAITLSDLCGDDTHLTEVHPEKHWAPGMPCDSGWLPDKHQHSTGVEAMFSMYEAVMKSFSCGSGPAVFLPASLEWMTKAIQLMEKRGRTGWVRCPHAGCWSNLQWP